ncbi:SdpI family protein [Ectobacillus ponti]|uniref:SdpI family protein n=1 Tax=Ectobacillus ponti TaxID=2961894 RepID=A0AA42BR13_9BACI|nr:SdpI family protein [Ectobacillus ponti]MCP8970840.1 SdpI family protein [Ectobacillus ponti]
MKSRIYMSVLALITIGIGVWGHFHLPDTLPIHWNWQGEVDGYGSKYSVIFGFPIIAVVLYVMRVATPKLDPRKENYEKFKGSYAVIMNTLFTFFVIMYGIVILNGAGYEIDVNTIMPVLVGLLFIILGNYMQRLKSNYFIGVRTPWALHNDEVWRYTNRVGARTFVIAGVVLIAAAFVPASWKVSLFIGAVVLAAVVPVAASYLYFRKLSR